MIAEAENEVNHGPNDLAYECINAVRERAGISKLQENLDETNFREAIKDERAMELCFEYNTTLRSDPLGRLLQTDAGTSK